MKKVKTHLSHQREAIEDGSLGRRQPLFIDTCTSKSVHVRGCSGAIDKGATGSRKEGTQDALSNDFAELLEEGLVEGALNTREEGRKQLEEEGEEVCIEGVACLKGRKEPISTKFCKTL